MLSEQKTNRVTPVEHSYSEENLYRMIYEAAKHPYPADIERVLPWSLTVDILQGDFTPCSQFAFENNIPAVMLLINTFRANKNLAVYAAARGGHTKLVDLLLTLGANVDDALLGAARAGNDTLVEDLIAKGASFFEGAAYHAAKDRHFKLVQHFIARDSNPNVRGQALRGIATFATKEDMEWVNYFTQTMTNPMYAFWGASEAGNLSFLDFLLEKFKHLGPFEPRSYLDKALRNAALRGSNLLVLELLGRGAHRDAAINGAARGGHKRLLTVLLDDQAASTSVDEAAFQAAAGGHVYLISYLVHERKANLDRVLAGAAYVGDLDLVKQYSETASVNGKYTALKLAAQNGHMNVVNYFLTLGELDSAEDRAMYAAAKGCQTQMVNLFLHQPTWLLSIFTDSEVKRTGLIDNIAKNKHQMAFMESIISQAAIHIRSRLLDRAVLAIEHAGYVKNEIDMLFILSEFKDATFRKKFLAATQKNRFVPDVASDTLLLTANRMADYRQQGLTFDQSFACVQLRLYELFTFISKAKFENYLGEQWFIVASYLFPLHGEAPQKIGFILKREHVLRDVNHYYASLGRLSYFSYAAQEARELMELCQKTESTQALYDVLGQVADREGNGDLQKVVHKYRFP